MAKNAKAVPGRVVAQSNVAVMLDGIKSKKDFAYQQAKHEDATNDFRAWAAANIAGFPNDVSEEDRAEIYAGYQLRFNDNNPAVQYIVEGDNYIPVVAGMDLSKREVVSIGIDYAMSITTYDFGRMRTKEPKRHALVKDLRDKFSTYCTGRWKRLIQKDGGSKSRSANNTWTKHMEDVQAASVKRNKNALAKGDPTAVGVEILNQAWLAFWNVIKK